MIPPKPAGFRSRNSVVTPPRPNFNAPLPTTLWRNVFQWHRLSRRKNFLNPRRPIQTLLQGCTNGFCARLSTGWSRFIGTRLLETEENLLRWVHSHFRRGSEEANKRRVGIVASDMLTYSCKTSDPSDPGVITFTFKHFEGHCVLRMEDQDNPISSAQFERARQAAKETTIAKDILPLASIFQSSLEVEKDNRQDNRVLEVKIKTFDPRKVRTGSDDGADSSS